MPNNGIGTRMSHWWYLVIVTIDLIRAQSPFDGGGGGFLADPFLELTAGVTTPVNQKSIKPEPGCVTNGALAGSIIATLLLSAFIAFLTWMIYLRQKLQELRLYENQEEKPGRASPQNDHRTVPLTSNHKQPNKKPHIHDGVSDHNGNQLPLDVTDYKFGTFPFRQSQTPSVNGHYNHTDWLNRNSSSFRSAKMDPDSQMLDIELLDPTFSGLNFSITGNMRAGIFVKEILDQGASERKVKLNSSDQLRTGDRIIALTVCFESIVYEDALTILSYASPYPVILRVQRPLNSTKVNVITEKRPPTANKVKWRDDFEHYDNDTSNTRSLLQPTTSTSVSTDTKPVTLTAQHRASSKTPRANKKPPSTSKGNKIKAVSNTILATASSTTKRSNTETKKSRQQITPNQMMLMSTGLTAKPTEKIATPPISTTKTTVKSVTNAVISYLHYKGANGGHATDVTNNSEATVMPYYDSPYDYYYGAHISQSHLNKNNNNSVSAESLTAVTSVYTIQLSSTKSTHPLIQRDIIPRRCERRLSSPAILAPVIIKKVDDKETSLEIIDTCV